ncbi:MAG: LacI family transcriptional regulator, partial [Oligosphaeraceae bacterium]|nr:LacI family transcriptional regulator [Oligosphaeraceae bacterium]
TLSEIATMAGVTPSTVSRALNPAASHLLSKKTSERILALCDHVGYRPSLLARGTATGFTYKVAMILHDMEKDLNAHDWNRITCATSAFLQESGYSLVLLRTSEKGTSMDMQVSHFLMSGIADAYITSPSMLKNNTLEMLNSLKSPLFVICEHGVPFPVSDGVLRSDADAFKQVWSRIPKEMHGKICFLSTINDNTQRLLTNIKRAAWDLGIDANNAISTLSLARTSKVPAMEYAEAYHQTKKMIKSFNQFDFVWCISDFFALGVKDALTECGRCPGKDVFILGYGDLETFPGVSEKPVLSTISANTHEIARNMCSVIMKKLDGEHTDIVTVKSSFISRSTF